MSALIILEDNSFSLSHPLNSSKNSLPSRLLSPKVVAPKIRENYRRIYDWHIQNGIDKSETIRLDEDLHSDYLELLSKLEPTDTASIAHMFKVANSILNGILHWSANEKSESATLTFWAQNIDRLRKEFGAEHLKDFRKRTGNKKAKHQDVASDFLTKNFLRLSELMKHKMYEKNVGGLIALMETNAQYNDKIAVSPSMIGFSEIPPTEESNLVNLAISGKILIKEIRRGDGLLPYNIRLVLQNPFSNSVQFKISQGQIFENKQYQCNKQNLMSKEEYLGALEGNETKTIELDGCCINYAYGPPHLEPSNITIYQYVLDDYSSIPGIWSKMIRQARFYRSRKKLLLNRIRLNSTQNIQQKTKQKLLLAIGITSLAALYFLIF